LTARAKPIIALGVGPDQAEATQRSDRSMARQGVLCRQAARTTLALARANARIKPTQRVCQTRWTAWQRPASLDAVTYEAATKHTYPQSELLRNHQRVDQR